jgi:glycosyltransferase involved in cell wall biosynthesis
MTIPTVEQVRVTVIIPFFNAERFLPEAVESVFAQTYTHWELLLINDGSTDGSGELARGYAAARPGQVRQLEHAGGNNRGISASINLGLANAIGEYVALLDADDVWLPEKLSEQVAIMDGDPFIGMVYGRTLFWYSWQAEGDDASQDEEVDIGRNVNRRVDPPDILTAALRGDAQLPNPCSILFRRELALAIGGFEEEFRFHFTDQAFYTKLLVTAPVYPAATCWDKYRRHAASSVAVMHAKGTYTAHRLKYLRWAEGYLSRSGMQRSDPWYLIHDARLKLEHPVYHRLRWLKKKLAKRIRHLLRRPNLDRTGRPAPGRVRFGSLRRVAPVNRHWGWERGLPIDRHYIEQFLRRSAVDVRGRVLEIGDASYTRQFGGDRVTQVDVLNVDRSDPATTIVADLTDAPHIPTETFDCIICTQTLQFIFDVSLAMQTLHRILKPGGVLLLTAPGITQLTDDNWQASWYWSFTIPSLTRLAGHYFGTHAVTAVSYGNVLAATSFLHGLAREELREQELTAQDSAFPVVIGLRAVKH